MLKKYSALLCLIIWVMTVVTGKTPVLGIMIPGNGIEISPSQTAPSFALHGSMYQTANVPILPATDAPAGSDLGKIIEVTTSQKARNPWDIQLQAKTTQALHKGDTLIGTIWLRGHALDSKHQAQVSFGLEKAGPPWIGTGWSTFTVTSNWHRYEVAMSVPADFEAQQMLINVRLGYQPQRIEVGPVVVTNYQRQFSVLRYERMKEADKHRTQPPMGRNLSYWAPQQLVAPPLRQQISLNGTWDFTPEGQEKNEIPVPEYWDAKPGFYCDQATYQRKVSVPADWQGKRIVVAFEGVNHIADVSVNGHQLGQHLGGFVPFEFDVTSYVKTGQTFDLKVHVGGGVLEPIVDEIDKALWPVGWDGVTSQWGIIFPVWLRAYGPVYLDDTQIQTSFRNKQITVNYTITNAVHQVGRKVPDDLMHITFGNEAATTFSWPTISRLEINHSKLMQNLIRDLERIIAPPHWPVSCSISTDRRDFHGLCIRSVH